MAGMTTMECIAAADWQFLRDNRGRHRIAWRATMGIAAGWQPRDSADAYLERKPMSDSGISKSSIDALESRDSQRQDQSFSLRKILPSGRALLLLLIPLAMLEFYLHLIWLGEIARGFQPPVSTVEHIVYGCIVFYPMLVLITMFVKATYYLVRAALR
jgi:hypothetical protein